MSLSNTESLASCPSNRESTGSGYPECGNRGLSHEHVVFGDILHEEILECGIESIEFVVTAVERGFFH